MCVYMFSVATALIPVYDLEKSTLLEINTGVMKMTVSALFYQFIRT